MSFQDKIDELAKAQLQETPAREVQALRAAAQRLDLIDADERQRPKLGLAGETLKLEDEALAPLCEALAAAGEVVSLALTGEPYVAYAHGWILIVAADQLGSISEKRFISERAHIAGQCAVFITRGDLVPDADQQRILDYAKRLFSPPLEASAVRFFSQNILNSFIESYSETVRSGMEETRRRERAHAAEALQRQLSALQARGGVAAAPSETAALRARLDALESAVEEARGELRRGLDALRDEVRASLRSERGGSAPTDAQLRAAEHLLEQGAARIIAQGLEALRAQVDAESAPLPALGALELSEAPRYAPMALSRDKITFTKLLTGGAGALLLRSVVSTPMAVFLGLLMTQLPVERVLDGLIDRSGEQAAYAEALDGWLRDGLKRGEQEGERALKRLSASCAAQLREALTEAEAADQRRASQDTRYAAIQGVIEALRAGNQTTGG